MTDSGRPVVDRTMLRLIEDVFRDEDYEVVALTADEGSVPMVLAENNYFMAAATAVATVEDLALAEPHLVSRLAVATSAANAGPKRWDAYALLLTQQEAGADDSVTNRLFEMSYDTSRARRIVQAGVKADLVSVRRAIVPFIEPPEFVTGDLLEDPLTQIEEELIRRGANPELASRAVEVYRSGGSLSDAL